MANIVITNYCNLQCPYCFANKMMTLDKKQDITLDQLDRILNWLGKSNNESYHLGLIGGEPTLHPQFNLIINRFNEFFTKHKGNMTLFTNGLNLDKYISLIPENMFILININQLSNNLIDKLIKNLDLFNSLELFKEKITLGCNICSDIQDYSFFWDIIDRYSDIKKVRMSVVAPTKQEQKKNKDKYYNDMKPYLLDFIKEAQKRNITIDNDCNQIPKCYFKDPYFFGIFNKPKYFICYPVIDITPNFFATSCFGISEFVDCNHFETINELSQYFMLKILPKKIEFNNTGKCNQCKEFIYGKCQGGCLAFSQF